MSSPEMVLEFDTKQEATFSQPLVSLAPTKATAHPYAPDVPTLPRDIYEYLPPSGAPFSLFGDPYSQLVYVKNEINVIRRSYYWLEEREKENNFTDNEIALLGFLSKHRCATSRQLKAIIFDGVQNMTPKKIKDFLSKCVTKGIIVPFTWQSPCPLDRERPRIYGLSPVSANLAEQIFNLPYQLPRNFKFLPNDFTKVTNPGMHDIFNFVIANELYCHLKKLDRVLDWHVNKRFRLNNGQSFYPQFVAQIIKDRQDFISYWIEVIRPRENWYNHTVKRFQEISRAIEGLSEHDKPERLILIVDDDSRIPDIAKLASVFLPDVVLRFTSDARMLNDWSSQTLVMFDEMEEKLKAAPVKYLKPDYTGMSASAYYDSFAAKNLDLMLDDELDL